MAPFRLLLVLCSAWASLCSAEVLFGRPVELVPSVRAQPRGAASSRDAQTQASALLRESMELRRAGKPKEGLRKLRDAYALVPTPTLLWPIAETCLEADQPAEGLDALRRYREQMTPEEMEPGQQLADAERLEQRLRERQAGVPGSPGSTMALNAGGTKDPEAPGAAYRPHGLTWAAVSLTGVVLLAATGVGAAALAKTESLNAMCPDRLCLPTAETPLEGLNADVSTQHKLSIAGQALWGVGAALTVGTVTLVIIDWKRQQKGQALLSSRSWSVTPLVGLVAPGRPASGAVAGVLLGGRF